MPTPLYLICNYIILVIVVEAVKLCIKTGNICPANRLRPHSPVWISICFLEGFQQGVFVNRDLTGLMNDLTGVC